MKTEGQDPLYGDKPWLPEPRTSPYLEELKVRYQRINDGLFALSQVDASYSALLHEVQRVRDYVAEQIKEEESKLNG